MSALSAPSAEAGAATTAATTAGITAAGMAVTGIGVITKATDEPARLLDPSHRPAEPDADWFDARSRLGGRGYKYLPASCHYLIAATRNAIADSGGAIALVPETDRGLAVGTNGGVAALHHDMDHTVIERGADDLSPALAPFFSINLIAGRVSMEHAIKGFNLTVNTPLVAGLEAVAAGSNAIAAGRAGAVLVGATEAVGPEFGPEFGTEDGAEAGAVALMVQPATASRPATRSYGRCEVRTAFVPPRPLESPAGWLAAVQRLARWLGTVPPHAGLHVFADESAVGGALVEGLRRATGRVAPAVPPRAGCLAPMLLTAGLLAGTDGPHLVAVASPAGHIAVALVRYPPPRMNAEGDH